MNTQYNNDFLRFSWILSDSVTYKSGTVTAAIVFLGTEAEQNYALKTIPFTIKVENSLDFLDIEPPLKNWFADIESRLFKLENNEQLEDSRNFSNIPIGTIISYMGKDCPNNYLICDGTVYDIDSYPELAKHFLKQFDSMNFFGGDGVTTFAVPDLRGEFLRGSGTATRNTGRGAAVGVHQNPTQIPFSGIDSNNKYLASYYNNQTTNPEDFMPQNKDGNIQTSATINLYSPASNFSVAKAETAYMTRPTNTAVSYCIKYNNYFDKGNSQQSNNIDINEVTNKVIEKLEQEKYIDNNISISVEENNAVTKKEDGLYVNSESEKIVSIEEQLSSIKRYEKFVNTELEYGEYIINNSFSPCIDCNISYGQKIPFNTLFDGNIQMINEKIPLKAGKTYEIVLHIYAKTSIVSDLSIAVFSDKKNNRVSSSLVLLAGNYPDTWNNPCSISCIYTPEANDTIWIKSIDNNSNTIIRINQASLSVKEIGRPIIIDPLGYSEKENSLEDTPVGNLINYMGVNAPVHHLICDGSIYEIDEYPYLAEHFEAQFGSSNHFGGDGVSTFAVPDLHDGFLNETGNAVLTCIKAEPTYFMKIG